MNNFACNFKVLRAASTIDQIVATPAILAYHYRLGEPSTFCVTRCAEQPHHEGGQRCAGSWTSHSRPEAAVLLAQLIGRAGPAILPRQADNENRENKQGEVGMRDNIIPFPQRPKLRDRRDGQFEQYTDTDMDIRWQESPAPRSGVLDSAFDVEHRPWTELVTEWNKRR
ncbi:MAG: hypothetical protein MJE12_24105 [Alphaproteobacteria bacterium]|nr:hypothetical protein [Alphaproteobacteria bacterium]